MPEMITPEYGVFSPPEPLPTPHDLSNGAHGNQLRFGILDFTNTTTVKQWNQVLDWLKSKGVPTDNHIFFTPQNAGGLGSTLVIFVGFLGEQSAHDATMLYNQPETALTALRVAFRLGQAGRFEPFPGFETIDEQAVDPVGVPLWNRNTPGWARNFARYYDVAPGFDAGKYPRGARYSRLATGEEFVRAEIIDGFERDAGNWGGKVKLRPVWERVG